MKYKFYIIIIVSLICIFSGCVVSETEHENQFFETLFVEQQYSVYETESNCYYFDDGIYTAEKYGNSSKRIPRTENAEIWTVYGDYVYFSDKDSICRIKTNGKDFKILLNVSPLLSEDKAEVRKIIVSENKVFFTLGIELYMYDETAEKTEFIFRDARTAEISGNKLYFTGADFSIHEFDIQSETDSIILKGTNSYDKNSSENLYKNFVFIDGEMYYYKRNPDGLYCYDDGENTLISDNKNINEFSLCEYRNELYFIEFPQQNETATLFKYNPQNGSITKVAAVEDYSRNAKIINGFLFYEDADYKVRKMNIE